MVLTLLMLSLGAVSSAASYEEGVHYVRLQNPGPRIDLQAKHEVVELFWYGCSHCFRFEPHIAKWLESKPDDVHFIRVPAALNKRWETHARAYYALELMGQLEHAHKLLFEAIHEQGRRLMDKQSIARFLGQNGVNEEQFLKTYDSLEVETKLNRAKELPIQYGITGTPAIIVDGTYRISPSQAGSYPAVLEIVDQLTSK